MKKILLLLSCGLFVTSCINNDYDLGEVSTDNITLGGENSEYKIPLLSISVTLSEITEGDINIQEVLNQANIWLPNEIPGGVDYVQINNLDDATYVNSLLDALIAEMMTNKAGKMDQVLDHIWDTPNYKMQFAELLNLPGNIDINLITEELFKSTFKSQFASNIAIHNLAKTEANTYLTDIHITPIEYQLDGLGLDGSVLDMLAENLDSKTTQNPKNTLSIYGQIDSKLPLSIQLDPVFTPTSVKIANIVVEANGQSKVAETRIYEEDIREIASGKTTISIPVKLQKYYPGKPFNTAIEQQLVIHLRLVKRGGLKL